MSQSNEQAEQAIHKINKNMRLKQTQTFKLVSVKGPNGKVAHMRKEAADELCKKEGYAIFVAKGAPEPKTEPKSEEVTAESIRAIRSNKDADAFIADYGLELELAEGATLSDKKDAIIASLELAE